MPPLQTAVTQFQAPGARGMAANMETRNIMSRTLTGAPAKFGVPIYAAGAGLCSIAAADGDLLGISRRAGTINPVNGGDQYVAGDSVPIFEDIVVWVLTGDAVAERAPANYDPVADHWTDAAVAGNVIAVPGAEFDSATDAAGLALVRFRRPIQP
jgi:hypothetical protein